MLFYQMIKQFWAKVKSVDIDVVDDERLVDIDGSARHAVGSLIVIALRDFVRYEKNYLIFSISIYALQTWSLRLSSSSPTMNVYLKVVFLLF